MAGAASTRDRRSASEATRAAKTSVGPHLHQSIIPPPIGLSTAPLKVDVWFNVSAASFAVTRMRLPKRALTFSWMRSRTPAPSLVTKTRMLLELLFQL